MQRLIICGGGHVSLELAHIAARLDFEVWVLDDRPEFATGERFPMASRVIFQPFDQAMAQLDRRPTDFFCVLTRAHTFDRDCLAAILSGSFAFAGMIGSRRKIGAVMEALTAQGFTREQLDRVHAPIGLLLGGETPAEVAVEIAAQLVQERAKLGPVLTPPPVDEPGILCTITKKTGSAPRSPGTWMHMKPDGTTTGTVGGGAVEFHAIQDARTFWAEGTPEADRTYDVGDPALMGSAYSGRVSIHFTLQKGQT